jgi:hypothetical protein
MSSRLKTFLFISAALLTVPFIASFFTGEVKWSAMDFVIMGVLLTSASVGVDWALKKAKTPQMKWAYALVILTALALLWAEMAVGIFNSPIAGN